MIGIFDSGVGGLTALYELRKIAPNVDICFLADRKNAPYGTKSQEVLINLVKDDIARLRDAGAEKILMACCTASTVYPFLSEEEKAISVPIISPAASTAAKLTGTGNIGVIATKRTAESLAFSKEILKLLPTANIFELETQDFVSLVEDGARDGLITEKIRAEIERTLVPLKNKNIDTLILGCTHFPHIKHEIERALPDVKTVNPSREGAIDIAGKAKLFENGKTVYLEELFI